MKKILFTISLIVSLTELIGQFGYLEDPSCENVIIWSYCNSNSTPDAQPGNWNVYKKASDSLKYIGLVMRGPNSSGEVMKNEDAQTRLFSPLLEGEGYKVFVDLAFAPEMTDGNASYTNAPFLRILGSNNICSSSWLLAQSSLIDNTEWETYEFIVRPEQNINVLKFEIYNSPLKSSYLLLDNIRIFKIIPESATNIMGNENVCPNQTNVSYSIPPIYSATNYYWEYSGTGVNINKVQNNITIDFLDNATSGILKVQGVNENGNGPFSSDFEITVENLPETPTEIIGESEVCLNSGTNSEGYYISEIKYATSYIWRFSGEQAILNQDHTNSILNFTNSSGDGALSVIGKNRCGLGRDSIILDINFILCNEFLFDIPNTFTPNGDGINEMFIIENLPPYSQLSIFNRLGTRIYYSDNYSNEWDGKDINGNILKTGTYWYILKTISIEEAFTGFVYLKR